MNYKHDDPSPIGMFILERLMNRLAFDNVIIYINKLVLWGL